MRKVTAYLFLFVYLFANTELHELAKVGAFVAHFAEHQKENKDITLTEFIEIHYFSGNVIDDDYEQDMKLPFKTTDCNNFSPTHTIPQPVYFTFQPAIFIELAGLPLYDQSVLPASHLADIWQPPKAC
jgi:hypothetical protein